jgi:hypothetical protein
MSLNTMLPSLVVACGVHPVHPARRVHFLPEPATEFGVVAQVRPDHLQRYRPPRRSERQVNPSHAAGT